jgi:sulfur-oxidizing protein SoxY
MSEAREVPRRAALLLTAAPAAAAAAGSAEAPAVEAAIREVTGAAPVEEGGIALRLPALAENGAQVPLAVVVDSPMTPESHVVSIHLFATRNPTPSVARFHLSPALARAEVQTRIRLAEDQRVVALAVMSDGRVRRAAAETRVATGGCLG